jgi:hypothetical protein
VAALADAVATADTGNTPNATGSFTPVAGDLLVCIVQVSDSVTETTVPTASANGITFTHVRSQAFRTSLDRLNVYVANQLVPASPVAMTVTYSPGDAGTGTNIWVKRVTGMTNTGSAAIKQSAGASNQTGTGTPAVTLPAAALTSNPLIGVLALAVPTGNPYCTPPTSWTRPAGNPGQLSYSTPTTAAEYYFRDSGHTSATVTWGSAIVGNSGWASLVVEFDAGGGAVGFTVDPATLTLTAEEVTFGGSGAVAITVDPAAVALAGQEVVLAGTAAASLPVDPATLILTGSEVALNGVTWAGQFVTWGGANIFWTETPQPQEWTVDPATLSLTAVDVALAGTGAAPLAVDPATLAVTAADVAFAGSGPAAITVDPATLTFTGADVGLTGAAAITVDPATVALTGVDVVVAGRTLGASTSVREFDGSDDTIRHSTGALAGMTHGTVAAIFKTDTITGSHAILAFHGSGNNFVGAGLGTNENDLVGCSASGFNRLFDVLVTGRWYLAVARKTSGTTVPRMSLYDFTAGTWVHGDGNNSEANWTAPGASGEIRHDVSGAFDFFDGRMAVRAAWSNTLPWSADTTGDAAIVAAGLEDALQSWANASPSALWRYNQDPLSAVDDLTAGGANQIFVTGTTVVSGDGPPGFDFSLGAAPLAVDPATVTLQGAEVTLAAAGGGPQSWTVDPAALGLVGVDVVFAGTGAAAAAVDPAVLALAAQEVAFAPLGAAAWAVDPATLSLTAIDVTVTGVGAVALPVDPGVLPLVAVDLTLAGASPAILAVDPATLVLTAVDLTLGTGAAERIIDPATLTITGRDVAFAGTGAGGLAVDPATLLLTAVDIALITGIFPTVQLTVTVGPTRSRAQFSVVLSRGAGTDLTVEASRLGMDVADTRSRAQAAASPTRERPRGTVAAVRSRAQVNQVGPTRQGLEVGPSRDGVGMP